MILALTCTIIPASAQPLTADVILDVQDPDVAFVAEFLDLDGGDLQLTQSIPGFSVTLMPDPTAPSGDVILRMRVTVNLALDCSPSSGVWHVGETRPFLLNGVRVLTALDLASSSSSETTLRRTGGEPALDDCIEDQIRAVSTLPAGQYKIDAELIAADTGAPLGDDSRIIRIEYASPQEVQINLLFPEDNEFVASEFPMFAWDSDQPNVRLFVFEMQSYHSSIQEVIGSTTPHLALDVAGASAVNFPPDALRRLEVGKNYIWFVEALVETPAGPVVQRSPIRRFTVAPEGMTGMGTIEMTPQEAAEIRRLLSRLSAELALMGLSIDQIFLDEVPITAAQFIETLRRLRREDVPLEISVADQ